MWSIHVFGTLQCIVLAVQELLGVCTVLYVQEGYGMSGGVEGRGDGEGVHGCGQVSVWVLWLVVYVGGCDFIVQAPCRAFCMRVVTCLVFIYEPYVCMPVWCFIEFALSQWMWRGRGCLLPMGLGCCAWQGALARTTPEGPSIS